MKHRLPALLSRIRLTYLLITAVFFLDYISYLTRFGVILPTFSPYDIGVIVGSWAGALLLWFIVGRLLTVGPRSYLFVFTLYLFWYHLFGTYRFRSKIPFDVTVMMDNAGIAFNTESVAVIIDSVSLHVLLIGIVPILAVLFIRPLRRMVLNEWKGGWRRYLSAAAASILYGWLVMSPYATYDELGSVIRSVHDYVRRDALYKLDKAIDPESYPFIRENKATPPPPAKMPNIIVIMIESFSQAVVEQKTPEGTVYTPYLNEKLKEGLYVERFYANSIQSAKGQFAFLFSLIPSFKQKVFTSYTYTRFHSLPQELTDHGYATMFFKAFRDVNFDNTGNFLLKNGVETALSIVPLLSEEDKRHMWGWGIEDKIFYTRFFEYLDSRKDIVSGERPVFAVLHTVMNHMRFNEVPRDERHIYPDAQGIPQHYANSIRLTDEQLPVFFEELAKRDYLRDTIVIVTGDHSYPTGQHGFIANETAWYEEFFRTPFLIWSPGRIAPRRLTDKAYSQMDVAPTLLDLAGIAPKAHHFRGVSMLADKPQQTIYLIQPYNGIALGVLGDGRWKYIHHLRSDREYLYDLANDPKETKNLISSAPSDLVDRLRGGIQSIYLNQYLIEKDRVWKPEENNKK